MEKKKPNLFALPENAKTVFDGERWTVHQWEQKQFDGSTAIYETVSRIGTVVIIPVLADGSVVIEKERQAHWERAYLSIPAGGLEKGEDPLEGARRETEEELGMVFSTYTLVAVEDVLHGLRWPCYTYIATDLEKEVPQSLDAGEEISTLRVTPQELLELLRKKEFRFTARFIEDFIIRGKENEFFECLKDPKKFEISL